MIILDNVAVGDDYTAAATIEDVYASTGGYFAVYGADTFIQLQYGRHGLEFWTVETRAPVGNGVLAAGTIGVRFRNAVEGSTATVSAALSAEAEPPLAIVAGGNSQSPTVAGAASIPVNYTGPGTTTLVAAVAGRIVEIVACYLLAQSATTIELLSSGGGAIVGPTGHAASTGYVLGFGGIWGTTATGEGLQMTVGSAAQVGGVLVYRQVAG